MSTQTLSRPRFLLSLFLLTTSLSAQIFDRNLVSNGGAEAGAGITDATQSPVRDVPNWTLAGGFTVAVYDGDSLQTRPANWPDRGQKYFVGGPNPSIRSTASQTIDLTSAAAEIDAGRVRFRLAGFLGGNGDAAAASIRATFQSGSGATLLESAVNGPTKRESNFTPALFLRATSGYLLPNIRKVVITIDLTDPTAVDTLASGADEVSLVLGQNEPITGGNLVVNGNVEAGPAIPECNQIGESVVPGWNASFHLGSARYGDCNLTASTPGPSDRGSNYLSTYDNSRAWQAVDITLARDLVDGGSVRFRFAAWLGGYEDEDDQARATVSFRNAAGNVLGSAQLGPVVKADRENKSALLERSTDGGVPAGTRSIVVEVELLLGPNGRSVAPAADNVSLTLVAGAAGVNISSIANAASLAAGPVAPGEMVALFTTGVNLSSAVRMQLDSSGRLATELGGVKVFFDGTQAPLLAVSSSQVTAVAPYDLDVKTETKVRLEYKGVESNTVIQAVAKTAPGIFSQEESGKGAGEIYNEGWQLNSRTNPAAVGSVVTIYWTGGGQTFPAGTDGRIETQTTPRPSAEISVQIGGQPATVVYAGGVPFTWSGLLIAQVRVPAGVSGDALPVVITAGSASSPTNAVTLAVRP